jgi:hypothetical protein
MKLYPRLGRRFAHEEFARQASLSPTELSELAAGSHPLQVWPATGASRITPAELLEIRSELVGAAREHGWPSPLGRDDQRELDLAVARVLWERTDLTPAEAGFGDVWSFLALVVAPDVVWWRAVGSTNVERFVASDLTRHTLARLWWRAQLFTWGLGEPEQGWELWRSSAIGEADLDQIQTRRGGYGRSPKAFRALVRVYPLVTTLATEAGVDRRDFWRQAYLRWVLRLGAFTDFSALSERELDEDLAAVAHRLEPTGADGGGVDSALAEVSEGAEVSDGGDFDDQPLETIVLRLVEAVRARGEVADADLCAALESVAGVSVPADRHEIVAGIAWQGAALRYLKRSDDDGLPIWRPGEVMPAADRRWGEWSVASFKRHVAQCDGDFDVDRLAAELFAGRAGKTIKRLVRAAIRETGAGR